MKKLLVLGLIILASCSNKTSSGSAATSGPAIPATSSQAPDKVVDISKLGLTQADTGLGLGINVDASPLVFDPTMSLPIQVIELTNTSSSVVSGLSVSVENSSQSNGPFQILFNHCSDSLTPGASCVVSIVAVTNGLYNGTYQGSFDVSVGTVPYQLPLSLTLTGKTDPSIGGTPLLVGSFDAPFSTFQNQDGTVGPDPRPYRIFTISNTGDGNAILSQPFQVGQVLNQSSNFSVLLSHCNSYLAPGQSCSIFVLFDNFRTDYGVYQNENFVMTYTDPTLANEQGLSVNFYSGVVTQLSSTFSVTLNYSSGLSVRTSISNYNTSYQCPASGPCHYGLTESEFITSIYDGSDPGVQLTPLSQSSQSYSSTSDQSTQLPYVSYIQTFRKSDIASPTVVTILSTMSVNYYRNNKHTSATNKLPFLLLTQNPVSSSWPSCINNGGTVIPPVKAADPIIATSIPFPSTLTVTMSCELVIYPGTSSLVLDDPYTPESN